MFLGSSYATAQTAYNLVAAADYTDRQSLTRSTLRTTSTTAAEFITIEVGSANLIFLWVACTLVIGLCFPWDGANDIDIDTSAVNMTVEYMVIFELHNGNGTRFTQP